MAGAEVLQARGMPGTEVAFLIGRTPFFRHLHNPNLRACGMTGAEVVGARQMEGNEVVETAGD